MGTSEIVRLVNLASDLETSEPEEESSLTNVSTMRLVSQVSDVETSESEDEGSFTSTSSLGFLTDNEDEIAYSTAVKSDNGVAQVRHKGTLADPVFVSEGSGYEMQEYFCREVELFNLQKDSIVGIHTAAIIESKYLAGVNLDFELFYKLSISNQGLTQMQYETVRLICQRQEKILPDRLRAGFLLGDGPGLGKTRIAAGVIKENDILGRGRSVYIASNSNSYSDVVNNLINVGNKSQVLQTDILPEFLEKNVVLFCTYKTLVAKEHENKSFVEKLVKLLGGKEFDGLFVLDDFHKARDMSTLENHRKAGMALLTLQKTFKHSRVLYCSSSAMTGPQHLAYMERLGLWGRRSLFYSPASLTREIKRAGLLALDLLAINLKEQGSFVSRNLTFNGVHFGVIELSMDPAFKTLYDTSVKVWQLLIEALNMLLDQEHTKVAKTFWLHHWMYFCAIITSIKIDPLIYLIKKEVSKGKSVVVEMHPPDRQFARDLEAGITSSPREELDLALRSLGFMFDGKHLLGSRFYDGLAIPTFEKLLTELYPLIPLNPLDVIKKKMEVETAVSDLTQVNNIKYNDELDLFQRCLKKVAILSNAASAGISLLDEEIPFGNRKGRRIVHVSLQMSLNPEKAMQKLGTTNRSNQASPTAYFFFQAPIPAEIETTSIIVSRLLSMGAAELTVPNISRRAICYSIGDDQHLTSESIKEFVKVTIKNGGVFKEQLLKCRILKADNDGNIKNETKTTDEFLKRMLSMEISAQEAVMSQVRSTMADLVNGKMKFDVAIHEIKRNGKSLPVKVSGIISFRINNASYALNKLIYDRGMPWTELELTLSVSSEQAFYQSSTDHAVVVCENNGTRSIYRPCTGSINLSTSFTLDNHIGITKQLAKKIWNDELERSLTLKCAHQTEHAKSVPQDCQCLSRYKNFYIITGPLYAELLTLQSLLELIRIVKVETEDGGIIGVLVPTNKINTLKKYVSIDPTL